MAHDDHVERREIKLGQSTRDLLEVTEGLDEGEAVVLDPTHLTVPVEVATTSDHDREHEGGEPAAAHTH